MGYPGTIMVRMRPEAIHHLLRTRAARGLDETTGARFLRGSAGIGFRFAGPGLGDRVITDFELPIYVAEEVVPILGRAVIDEKEEEGRSRLVIRSRRDPE